MEGARRACDAVKRAFVPCSFLAVVAFANFSGFYYSYTKLEILLHVLIFVGSIAGVFIGHYFTSPERINSNGVKYFARGIVLLSIWCFLYTIFSTIAFCIKCLGEFLWENPIVTLALCFITSVTCFFARREIRHRYNRVRRSFRRRRSWNLQPAEMTEEEAIAAALAASLEAQTPPTPPPVMCFPGASEVYDLFFAQCRSVGQELLDAKKVHRDAVEEMDSEFMINLNKVVILRAILSSAGTSGLKLSGGEVVKDTVMKSGDEIAQRMLKPFQEARSLLEVIKPSTDDAEWMESRLLNPEEYKVDDERKSLSDVCLKVTELAIEVTRLGVFKQRAHGLFEALSEQVARMLSRKLSRPGSQNTPAAEPLLQGAEA